MAGQPNFYGSLITETINFPKKVNGKGYMTGVGCKNGKRPWSIQYKAQDYSTIGRSHRDPDGLGQVALLI